MKDVPLDQAGNPSQPQILPGFLALTAKKQKHVYFSLIKLVAFLAKKIEFQSFTFQPKNHYDVTAPFHTVGVYDIPQFRGCFFVCLHINHLDIRKDGLLLHGFHIV
jgi:hypothetical protein